MCKPFFVGGDGYVGGLGGLVGWLWCDGLHGDVELVLLVGEDVDGFEIVGETIGCCANVFAIGGNMVVAVVAIFVGDTGFGHGVVIHECAFDGVVGFAVEGVAIYLTKAGCVGVWRGIDRGADSV